MIVLPINLMGIINNLILTWWLADCEPLGLCLETIDNDIPGSICKKSRSFAFAGAGVQGVLSDCE